MSTTVKLTAYKMKRTIDLDEAAHLTKKRKCISIDKLNRNIADIEKAFIIKQLLNLSLAEKEDPTVAYIIGSAYYFGRYNVKRDLKAAREYYSSGARFNHRDNCFCLGVMLFNGLGGDVNKPLAARMFMKAHNLGHLKGSLNFAQCLSTGDGVLINREAGRSILLQLCSNGYVDANYQLSVLLREEGNIVESNKQLEIAVSSGHVAASFHIASLKYYGTDNYIEDRSAAKEIYRKLYDESKHVQSAYNYALLLPVEDVKTIIECLTFAVQGGHESASHALGLRYEHGQGLEKDVCKAVELYTFAHNRGHDKASYQLGLLSQNNGDNLNALNFFKTSFSKGLEAGRGGDLLASRAKIVQILTTTMSTEGCSW